MKTHNTLVNAALKINRIISTFCVVLAGLGGTAVAWVSPAQAQPSLVPQPAFTAASLNEKYKTLTPALASSAFGRPLIIESLETNNRVTGDAYAVVDSPFSAASTSLQSADRLCDLIILHLNTKYCRPDASPSGTGSVLKVHFGKKTPQELASTFSIDFDMRVPAASTAFLAVLLDAPDGPLGTSNYRIEIDAIPVSGNKTFLHLRYSYGFGVTGRLAMRGYLATSGSKKIGFTKVEQDGTPGYVGGMRGAVERNTMRYYLAIEAYLASLRLPQSAQLDARLNAWFDATEKYPEQLGEVDKDAYLKMKKSEVVRQQGVAQR
jgi:hypothetical protein